MSTKSSIVLVVLAFAPALACETPPVSPAELASAAPVLPAHASPDPPPARPVMAEASEAGAESVAVDADGGVVEGGTPEAGASTNAPLPIIDADDVIASLRPRFRTCYQRGLADDANQRGRLVINAVVSPKGDVVTATASQAEVLNAAVVTCIVDVVKSAHFTAPGGRGGQLKIPINLVQSP